MKKLFIILALLAWLPLAYANDAEFDRGLRAYNAADYDKAFSIFKPIAEQGHAKAQLYFAQMHDYGQGTSQDSKEAAKWYRKAAEQGVANAQYNLASMLRGGKVLALDYDEAIKWYTKGAKQGYVFSQLALFAMYSTEEEIPKNLVKSYMWLSILVANGDEKTDRRLKKLERRMTIEEVLKAQDLAKECWFSRYENCPE